MDKGVKIMFCILGGLTAIMGVTRFIIGNVTHDPITLLYADVYFLLFFCNCLAYDLIKTHEDLKRLKDGSGDS